MDGDIQLHTSLNKNIYYKKINITDTEINYEEKQIMCTMFKVRDYQTYFITLIVLLM